MNLNMLADIADGRWEDILVDIVLRTLAIVGRVISATLHRAAKENTKVLVQVSQEGARTISMVVMEVADNILLSRAFTVGRHVLHERSSSTTIKEVDRHADRTTSICRSQATIEVWKKVDCDTIDFSWSEDTWNRNADVWLSVYNNMSAPSIDDG